MSKHTKGPWRTSIGPPEHCRVGKVETRIVPESPDCDMIIATCEYGVYGARQPEEAEANAALIAATPDYHEAAEHILTRSEPNEDGTWTVRMNEMVELRTAYAKAEPKP